MGGGFTSGPKFGKGRRGVVTPPELTGVSRPRWRWQLKRKVVK